uniref:Purinergic receptor n=1 Tax=Plectus sambesii TaxID=2011161 RepID=A0A914WYX4_9BILA
MTNSVITPEQKLDECPEDINVIGAYCTPTNSTTCAKGTRLSTGNGIMTGRCVNSNGELCNNQTNGICTCEVSGWCPVVHKFASTTPLFPGAKDFKILVKAYVQFPKLGADRQNVNDNRTDNDLLNGCIYDSQLSPLCPVFTIGYILQQANITNFTKIAVEGGLIRMSIQWHCDFDKGHGHECPPPNYQFEQLNAFSVNRLLPFWDLR